MLTANNKRLITLSFFLLAVLLYFIGVALPSAILLIVGVPAEWLFCLRLFSVWKRPSGH